MTDDEIRKVIADALVYAAVPGFRGSPRERDFVDGGADIQLADLDIDSLAAMELCIAIETNVGASILPQDLEKIGSLDSLVKKVREAV